MAKMNHEEFLNKMQEKFDLCMKEARVKNADYASHGKEGASGLNNFYETAAESGVTPLQAWHTHYYKHYLAIRQAVRGQELRSETLAGRFKDAAVYAIIGWLLAEEMEAEKKDNYPVQPQQIERTRFKPFCCNYDPEIWTTEDKERNRWLVCPDVEYATDLADAWNHQPKLADGLNWKTVTELNDYIEAARVSKANKQFSDSSIIQTTAFPPPLGNHNVSHEPRFHTAKDVQVDTKSPDGTSERWYVIDTWENRRLRVLGNNHQSISDLAFAICKDLNTTPSMATHYDLWEPFPAT